MEIKLNKTGSLIFWSAGDREIKTTDYPELGDFLPRNDYKAALLKSCKEYVMSRIENLGDRVPKSAKRPRYIRFKDTDETKVSIQTPSLDNGENFQLTESGVVILNKESGELTFENCDVEVEREIRENYETGKATLNNTQFLTAVKRYATSTDGCNGITCRPGSGGVYFVPATRSKQIEVLRTTIERSGGSLYVVSSVNDDESTAAIGKGISIEIEKEIQKLVGEIVENAATGMSENEYNKKVEKAETLIGRMKEYKEILQENVKTFTGEMETVIANLGKNMASIKVKKPFDLFGELEKMGTDRAKEVDAFVKSPEWIKAAVEDATDEEIPAAAAKPTTEEDDFSWME